MSDETLRLLQHALRTEGRNIAAISPVAAKLCGLIDHWNRLHWDDRNRYGEEVKRLTEDNKKLHALLAKLDTHSHQE